MTKIPNPGFGMDALALETSSGPAWVIDSVKSVPAPLREGSFASRAKDLRYYEVVEGSLHEQFEFHYFVLSDEASGGWALQPFFFTDQDLLAGLPQSVRRLFGGIRKFWPQFLKMRMLMVGCAAGEGELGHDEPWVAQALHAALEVYRRRSKAFIILLKDFPAKYRKSLEYFSRHGYQRAPSMPAAQLDFDFANFEEFMTEKLSKVFRKNLRRKLRASEDAGITMEVLSDATPVVDEIFPLHVQTFERSDFNFERLTPEYFRELGKRIPDRIRFFIWRHQGRVVAFNLCLIHEGVLYDLDVGLDYSVALEFSLYFRTWRDVVEWALQNGLKAYHTGPLNYDPKAHLKLRLIPQDLYARHNWAIANPFFKLAIKYLEPTRHDPTLKKFPNAHELQ